MRKINRRTFLSETSKAASAALVLSPSRLLVAAAASEMPIGFQTWTIRESLAKDFAGTLQMMAGMGYQQVEMCSPKGYAKVGFGPLVEMPVAEMRSKIEDAGLSCPSCHFVFAELIDSSQLDDRIEFARQLGLTQMICSTFWLPETATLKDYLEAADRLNLAAEEIKKAGMQAGFHNHGFEFATLDGRLIYDALMDRLDKELVKMQFQTEVINLGYKAADYFAKYPGRFISAHLSDWTADKKEVPVGQGIIDWNEFFAAARTGGLNNFIVEVGPEMFKDSAAFIRRLQV